MSHDDSFVATSLASLMMTRMSRTHERRRISVFSGPPGIGKTTAIRRFADQNKGKVAVFDVQRGPRNGHLSIAALEFAVNAIEGVLPDSASRYHVKRTFMELRYRLRDLVGHWAGLTSEQLRRQAIDLRATPQLSIVFDEAQSLSQDAIETLRSLNDASLGGPSPVPIGLIFVGNNDFILKSAHGRQSILTAAVADRLLYSESLEAADVTDDDIELYLESRAAFEPKALRLALTYFRRSNVDRSFRRADGLLDLIAAEVGDKPVTATTIQNILALA